MTVVHDTTQRSAAATPRGDGAWLAIEDLTVGIGTSSRSHSIVDRLSLTVARGETVALVGESGSGKSMTARAVVGLLPVGVQVAAGRVRLGPDELTGMTPRQMNGVRGRRIGMLFQQPQMMLDPTCRVGDQVAEALRHHHGVSRAAAHERVLELLRDVGIADPEQRARSYAHELSGGIAQRVMIAAALSADPELLIADEPTTSLDVTIQAQILRLLDDQRRKRNLAILIIAHDFSVVAAVASHVAVMYAGQIVEQGPTTGVLAAPRHPYTRALIACSLLKPNGGGVLASIRGAGVQARRVRVGCRFHPRCDAAHASSHHGDCTTAEPDLYDFADGSTVRCWAADVPSRDGAASQVASLAMNRLTE